MKYFMVLVLSLFLFYSCAETSNSGEELISSCLGVTCSGHGKCESTSGAPKCVCDEGYISTGDQCVFDCSNVENAKTNAYNNACVCEPGFVAEKNEAGDVTACVCGDGKAIVDGVCLYTCDDEHAFAGGGPLCVCDYGYFLGADGTCQFDCRHEDHGETNATNDGCECDEGYVMKNGECIYQCNTAGNMVVNASNTDCECKEGFFVTEDTTVCANPCTGVTCESNASCIAQDQHNYLCACDGIRDLKLQYNDKLILPDFVQNYGFQVASSGDTYAIVWSAHTVKDVDPSPDGRYNIYMMIVDSNGVVISAPKVVNGDHEKNKVNPTVTWGGDSYLVTWEDKRFEGEGSPAQDLFFKVIGKDGVEKSSEVHLTTSAYGTVYASNVKAIWNQTHSHFSIFWLEKRKNEAGIFQNQSLYYKLISADGNPVTADNKLATPTDIDVLSFDATLNQQNNYTVIWNENASPRRLFYQVLVGDPAVITAPSGSILLYGPINLVYRSVNTSNLKIIWNGSEYGIFYRNTSSGNRYQMIRMSADHIKLEPAIDLGFNTSFTDMFWNGNEYVFSYSASDLTLFRLSREGNYVESTRVSDGLNHTYSSRLIYHNLNDFKAFWLDNRDGVYALYTTVIGCY